VKRRDLLTGFVAGGAFTAANAYLWQKAANSFSPATADDPLVNAEPSSDRETLIDVLELDANDKPDAAAQAIEASVETLADSNRVEPKKAEDYLDKVRNFEDEFSDDIHLSESEAKVMHSVLLRLRGVERSVGHGNYNLISFDQAIKFAKRFSSVGQFTPQELNFIEKIFFTQAADYGFLGEKVSTELTASIKVADTKKIPYSGHYVYRGEAESYYQKLKKDVGDSIILTSGIRSNVKQMHLFLAKGVKSNYNLSKASRSLAPPGHSYHGVGDFDVGKIGWGNANFTDEFSKTDEFKRMQDLGYVKIRYTADNRFGVRYEPWHIKVV
jgi:hypothetical protein